MTWEQIMGRGLALVVMLIGLLGSILPVLPGTPIVLVAAIGHRLYFGAASINNAGFIALVVLTVVSLVFDFLAIALGATRRGAVGAVIGGIIGLFFSLLGIILGPLLGAMLFELRGGKEFKMAVKAGTRAVVGLLLGVIGKFSICVVMIALFATSVIYRSVN